ncbi:MAG TPA: hypothetical protein VMF08_10040 [Candidatus Sulfotelmatobacter sp.]|nr:hypothetical protein [Candidatus Sulfotelmatobacter sp.]
MRYANVRLPGDTPMNKDVENCLILTVHLADGEKLPLVMDTGNPVTILDKSLEQKLGKPLGSTNTDNFGQRINVTLFSPPPLYLEETPLAKPACGHYIFTMDCKEISAEAGRPIMGVLGMDILDNYSIQLNFTKGTIRFLDEQQVKKGGLGEKFALVNVGDGCFYIKENLTGMRGPGSLIDTGCNYDGWLTRQLFQNWTNRTSSPSKGEFHSPNGVLGGQLYHDLDLQVEDPLTNDFHTQLNGIGLHVLSRNLVTLDFPERMMFLKRISPTQKMK